MRQQQATLDKYAISFLYDVEAFLKTLEKAEQMRASLFVPAHTEPVEDMTELVRCNRDKVYEIAALLLDFCKTPLSFEQILQKVFAHYMLVMNFEQHVLAGSTIRSYLSWLKEQGKINVVFREQLLLWETVQQDHKTV